MMKLPPLYILFAVTVAAFISVTASDKTVFAYQICSGYVYITGATAQGCKDAYVNGGGTYWTGRINSRTDPSTNIDQIGWTYWNNNRFCGTSVVSSDVRGASYLYGLPNYFASRNNLVGSCSGSDNNANVAGNHYFANDGDSDAVESFKPLDLPN